MGIGADPMPSFPVNTFLRAYPSILVSCGMNHSPFQLLNLLRLNLFKNLWHKYWFYDISVFFLIMQKQEQFISIPFNHADISTQHQMTLASDNKGSVSWSQGSKDSSA